MNPKEEQVKIPMSVFLHMSFLLTMIPTSDKTYLVTETAKQRHVAAKTFMDSKRQKIAANRAYGEHMRAKDSEKNSTLEHYKGLRNGTADGVL